MQETEEIFINARNNNFEKSDKTSRSLFRCAEIKPVDNYKNNLLHIATEHSNVKYVEELLDAGYNQNAQNCFGKSSWDIAIENKNRVIIDKFVDNKMKKERTMLKRKISNLEMTIEELTVENKKLESQLTQNTKKMDCLSTSKNSLLVENLNLKRSSEILRNDNNVLLNVNKSIREENTNLKEANKKLKISVDALISSSMK